MGTGPSSFVETDSYVGENREKPDRVGKDKKKFEKKKEMSKSKQKNGSCEEKISIKKKSSNRLQIISN